MDIEYFYEELVVLQKLRITVGGILGVYLTKSLKLISTLIL